MRARIHSGFLRKLRENKGFSLVEMLACTVVLLLLALVLNTGLQAALDSYHSMIAKSETQLVVSTVIDGLADELRYTGQPEIFEYPAPTDRAGYGLELRDGRIYVPAYGGDGKVTGTRRLLPGGVYGNGAYYISELKVQYAEGVFTIEITAQEINGTISSSAVTSVRCLNGTTEGGATP